MSSGIGKVAGSVDWTRVLSRCNPQVRKGVMDLRAHHEDLRRQIADAKSSVPKLDFDYYKSKLPSKEYGTMLSEMEGKVKGFQPTKTDYSDKLKVLENEKQTQLQEASAFLNKLEGDVQALKAQLDKLRSAKPVEQMTVDDVYELNPEYKEKIYTAIKNDNWATEEEKDTDHKAHH
ncbi:hypothetical protein PSACC_03574 [Paramicrosporidium saccamoebae]|uniref:ATP synthase subunit d, mitochondrial n=1 Tax=Paramicrosporidium saccamoebae TaxID=1246581 RepID=A0A2H9TFL3_9FUNG|nr:hypothetical protein PSACC_03574 [Paramicrosporidium saccamoebae]